MTGDSVSTTFAPASAAVMDALTDAMATAKLVDGIGVETGEGIGGGDIGAASSSSAVLAAEAEAEAEAEATAAQAAGVGAVQPRG